MGKMRDLIADIQILVEKGYNPEEISSMLHCPLDWAYEVWDERHQIEQWMMLNQSPEDYAE